MPAPHVLMVFVLIMLLGACSLGLNLYTSYSRLFFY